MVTGNVSLLSRCSLFDSSLKSSLTVLCELTFFLSHFQMIQRHWARIYMILLQKIRVIKIIAIIKSYFQTYLASHNYLCSLKKWLTIRIWWFLLAQLKMWLNLERTLTHSLKRNLCELEITTFNLCLSICRMFKILPKHDLDLALSFPNVHY